VKGNRLGSDRDKAGGAGAKSPTQVKPYAITDPIAYAALASRRRYRQTRQRHTTRAALEHPLNEHEYRRAERAAVAHGALLVAVVFALALVWGWLSFSWDALKATATAWRTQAAKAHAVAEGTIALTTGLTLLALTTEGWGLLQAVKEYVVFALLTFPLVFAFVLRREIRWCSDPSERKALAHQRKDDGGDWPLLMLGETALPPGVVRARRMRGDEDA
jgi:hypothetical protein